MSREAVGQLYYLDESTSKEYLLLFILWPFLAFLIALKNYSQKVSRKVVYLFLVYYGLTFVNNNEYIDAFRYAERLKTYALMPFSDFFRIVSGIYSETTLDIFEPFTSFIISRFTSSSVIYFGVWAAIFGFFYLKSINLLHDRYQQNPTINGMIPMAFFTMILPITNISGVRMWTAAWIFFFGAYNVILNHNGKFLLITLFASLVHWSFIAANAILLIYYLAGNRNLIYFPLALISFVVPELVSPVFRTLSSAFGGGIQSRYENYSSESYILSQHDSLAQSSWFLKIGNDLVYYYLLFAIILIQFKSHNSVKDKSEKNLFSFLLLFLAFVNFGKAIPTLGGRFQLLFFLFATLYVFLYSIKVNETRINLLNILGLFPMLLYSAIIFRTGTESISVWLFTPVFGSPLLTSAWSLSEVIF